MIRHVLHFVLMILEIVICGTVHIGRWISDHSGYKLKYLQGAMKHIATHNAFSGCSNHIRFGIFGHASLEKVGLPLQRNHIHEIQWVGGIIDFRLAE